MINNMISLKNIYGRDRPAIIFRGTIQEIWSVPLIRLSKFAVPNFAVWNNFMRHNIWIIHKGNNWYAVKVLLNETAVI